MFFTFVQPQLFRSIRSSLRTFESVAVLQKLMSDCVRNSFRGGQAVSGQIISRNCAAQLCSKRLTVQDQVQDCYISRARKPSEFNSPNFPLRHKHEQKKLHPKHKRQHQRAGSKNDMKVLAPIRLTERARIDPAVTPTLATSTWLQSLSCPNEHN